MHPYTMRRVMVGGFLGTLAQTMVVYGIIPMMTSHAMDFEALRGYACSPSLFMHLFSGSVLFPLGYVYLVSQGFTGSSVLKGTLWGGLLWLVTEGVMVPMLGAGVFSAELGGAPAALRALLGYLAYGATLGGFTVAVEPEVRYAYARYAPVRAAHSVSVALLRPTVSLGVTSAVVSSCGPESGHIAPRVAHELCARPGRPLKGLRNVHHTVMRRTRSPSHPCGGVHRRRLRLPPRGGTDDTPPSAAGPRCGHIREAQRPHRSRVPWEAKAQMALLFSPPRDGFSLLDDPCQLGIENTRENF